MKQGRTKGIEHKTLLQACPVLTLSSVFACISIWSDLEGTEYFDQLQGNGV